MLILRRFHTAYARFCRQSGDAMECLLKSSISKLYRLRHIFIKIHNAWDIIFLKIYHWDTYLLNTIDTKSFGHCFSWQSITAGSGRFPMKSLVLHWLFYVWDNTLHVVFVFFAMKSVEFLWNQKTYQRQILSLIRDKRDNYCLWSETKET
jgi:hypothetical protein